MPNLLKDTLRLLETTQEPIDAIARGAHVRKRWLYMLAAGQIPNAGVQLVQRVYDYLAAQAERSSSSLTTPAPTRAARCVKKLAQA